MLTELIGRMISGVSTFRGVAENVVFENCASFMKDGKVLNRSLLFDMIVLDLSSAPSQFRDSSLVSSIRRFSKNMLFEKSNSCLSLIPLR